MDVKNSKDKTQYGVEAFEEGFYNALRIVIPASFEHLLPAIEKKKSELIAQNSHLADAALTQMHIAVTCLALATFEVLLQEHDRPHSLELTQAAFVGSVGNKVTSGTKEMINNATDPFQEIVTVSKQREDHYFGRSFSFERQQDDNSAYRLDITGCFYHQLLAAHGAADLTPAFCAFDGNWIEAIDSKTYGFRFERPTTIGWGHDRCRFYFFRELEDNKE